MLLSSHSCSYALREHNLASRGLKLHYFGFDFDAVRGRAPTLEGYRRRKPDPYYIETTLADLAVDDGLYVGDSPTDVVAGRRAGLETAFLRRPHNRDLPRPTGVTYELESLSDLPAILE